MYADNAEFDLLCDQLESFFDDAFATSSAPARSISA
jgi:hypothetical protein